MEHISFWFMLIVVLDWAAAYTEQRKTQKLHQSLKKKTGLAVNAKKTRYTIMYREQNRVK